MSTNQTETCRSRSLPMWRRLLLVSFCALLASCSEPDRFFAVDLSTDYVAGVDFSSVRVNLRAMDGSISRSGLHTAEPRDYTRPTRIMTLDAIELGAYTAEVLLLSAAGEVAGSRRFQFQVTGSYVLAARIDLACNFVMCPEDGGAAGATECLGGECVPPTCIDAIDCGLSDCDNDSDCGESPVSCREPVCVRGRCDLAEVDDACDDTEYCDLELGCEPRDFPAADAGVDAGVDAGIDAGIDAANDTSNDVGSDAGTGPGFPLGVGPYRPIGPRPVEPTALEQGTLFAANDGTGLLCTETAPCDLWTATDRAMAGDVVFLRGGVYNVDRNLYFRGRGDSPAPAVFESYPGEIAILEGTRDPEDEYYIRVLGAPVVLRRFEVRNMPRAGLSVRSNNHVLEGLRVYNNLLSGIHVHNSYATPDSNNNLITDCIAYDNSGAGLSSASFADGGNSDGISISSGSGNRVENCLAYNNSDDGIDTWRSSNGYVGYSIVYGSGIASGNGVGIKAGGIGPPDGTPPGGNDVVVEHCISFSNRSSGIDYNGGVDTRLVHNTAWNNGGSGFVGGSQTWMEVNLTDANARPFSGAGSEINNSWQRSGTPIFASTTFGEQDFLRPVEPSNFTVLGAYAFRDPAED